MTVQQLRHFIAVAQFQHFGEAARACYISQPSLSHSIAELESEMDMKLLYRTNRTVELSPAGKVFYLEAQDIIRRLDEAILHAKRANSGYAGTLNIGSLGGLSAGTFPGSVMLFRKKYPDIDVTFTLTNMRTLNMGLLKGTLDVALTRHIDVKHRSDELDWQVLYQDHFGLVFRKDHWLADKEQVDLKDLKDEPFVFLDQAVTPNVYKHTILMCTARGLVPVIMHVAPTLEIVCTLVKAGMGIALVPKCAMAYSANELSFLELEGEDAVSDVVLAWRRLNVNPIVPVFLEEFGIHMFSH